MTATGTLLNFNYIFTSCEFNQSATYNDIFGLFVSVNGGAFENIAKLDNSKHITITNLRAGRDGTQLTNGTGTGIGGVGTKYDYFAVTDFGMPNGDSQNCNGVTPVFNAQKEVSIGDTVTVKFAIADVGDTGYNSYVVIEAGSLSFNAPNANVDYSREFLKNLDAGREYAITVEHSTYRLTADSTGMIPLTGTDLDGKSYSFIGKTISVVRKGNGIEGDSEPQNILVANRPGAPASPSAPATTPTLGTSDVVTTSNSITITPEAGTEYSIDNGATWHKPDASTGKVTFTGLTTGSRITILTRFSATNDAPASLPSAGITVTAQNMLSNLALTVTNYSGFYDGAAHSATVSSVEGAVVSYSTALTGSYSSAPLRYTDAGTYTVYYQVVKEGCYPAYGTATVTIRAMEITFDATGGTVTPGSSRANANFRLDTLPAPTKSGYRFDGWYTAATDGVQVTTATVFAGDSTLYAHWTYTGGGSSVPYHTILATAGAGGSFNTGTYVFVPVGESAGFTIIPDKGYAIADVLVDGKSVGAVSSYIFTDVRADHTISATFKAARHINPQTGVEPDAARAVSRA